MCSAGELKGSGLWVACSENRRRGKDAAASTGRHFTDGATGRPSLGISLFVREIIKTR